MNILILAHDSPLPTLHRILVPRSPRWTVYKDWKETTLAIVFHDSIVDKLKRHGLSLETLHHLIAEGYLQVTSKAALQEMATEQQKE